MSEFVAEVSDANWATEVLASDKPVLVDFWGTSCPPCRMIAPTVEAVAEKFHGKAKVVKLNVDDNAEVPSTYGIRGIPTLMLFKGGVPVDSHVGVPSNAQAALSTMIEKQLA